MSVINYAVEIDLTTEGLHTSLTNTNYGVVNGIIRVITGTPGYTGVPTYPTYEDTSNNTNVYYEGLLTINGIANPSKRCNIEDSGDYAAFSNFSFILDNADNADATNFFWNFLLQNEVNLKNSKVDFYAVIDDVFYKRWTGIVDTDPYDVLDYRVNCVDPYRKYHKMIPSKTVSSYQGLELREIDRDSVIPITIGRVFNAKLFPIVRSDGVFPNLVSRSRYLSDIYSDTTRVFGIVDSTAVKEGENVGREILIETGNQAFAEDVFNNWYVRVVGGKGKDLVIKIVKSYASEQRTYDFLGTGSSTTENVVLLVLDTDIIDAELEGNIYVYSMEGQYDNDVDTGYTDLSDRSGDMVSFVQIQQSLVAYIVSENEVKEIDDTYTLSARGPHTVDDYGKMIQVNTLEKTTDLTNVAGTGYPGIVFTGVPLTEDAELKQIAYLDISSINVITRSWQTETTGSPSGGGTLFGTAPAQYSITTLHDRQNSTGLDILSAVTQNDSGTLTLNYTVTKRVTAVIDITPEDINGLQDMESVYLALDMDYIYDFVPRSLTAVGQESTEKVEISITIEPLDIWGRVIKTGTTFQHFIVDDYIVMKTSNGADAETFTFNLKSVPTGYLTDATGDSPLYAKTKRGLDIKEVVGKEEIELFVQKLRMTITYETFGGPEQDVANGGEHGPVKWTYVSGGAAGAPYDTYTLSTYPYVGEYIYNSDKTFIARVERFLDYTEGQDMSGVTFVRIVYSTITGTIPGSTETLYIGTQRTIVSTSTIYTQELQKGYDTNLNMRINDIGLIGQKGQTLEDLRIGLTGEVWGATLGLGSGRKATFLSPETPETIIEYLLRKYDGLTDAEIDTNSFQTVWLGAIQRIYMKMGRQLVVSKSSYEYILEICRQHCLVLYQDNAGKRKVRDFVNNKTVDYTHNESNILPGSLKPIERSPLTKVYTEGVFKYDYAVSDSLFKSKISITNTDQASFPEPTARTLLSNSETFASAVKELKTYFVTLYFVSDPTSIVVNQTILTYVPNTPSATSMGVFIKDSLVTNKYYDGANSRYVVICQTPVHKYISYLSETLPAMDGTLNVYTSYRTWTTYVGGLAESEYANAKEIWTRFQSAYKRVKYSNPVPQFLSENYWLRAKNTDGTNNTAMLLYLDILSKWITFPKERVEYSINLQDNIGIEFMESVNFSDAKLTNNQTRLGWITGIEYDTDDDKINIELTLDLNPQDPYQDTLTIDEGAEGIPSAADDYDENGAVHPDDVEEDF